MESNSTAFLIKIKLRHSLGRPSRSDFVQSGLSGIVKRYGFDTVQQFYNAIKIAQDATYKYQMDVATWDENYGEKTPPKATFEERLRIYQREADQQHTQRNYHSRDKGAR